LQLGRTWSFGVESFLLIAAASLTFGGCTQSVDGGATQDHVGRSIQAIVGGTVSGAADDAVVILARYENGGRVGLCTATMVAANLAVTARHCVSATDSSAACGSDGQPVVGALLHGDRVPSTLAVFAVTGGVAPDTRMDVGASARGKALVVDDSTTICNRDLAYVILDTALASPIAPIRLEAPATADTLTAVGFGITEAGSLPAVRMKRDGLSVIGAGPMAYPDDARYGVGDRELLLGESACLGDSGSPVLSPTGAVVGVASRAGNGQARDPKNDASVCLGTTAHAVYAQLATDNALAVRAFAEAGATPWLEGQPDPRIKPSNAPGTSSSGTASAGTADGSSGPKVPHSSSDLVPIPAAGAIGAADASDGTSGGCSASGEPTHGAVEHALGIVAAVLLILRLRSARRRRDDAEAAQGAARVSRRVPYVDLGMRESFASMPDDR